MADMLPTTEDLARNATADMAVCEAATPGPWHRETFPLDGKYGHNEYHEVTQGPANDARQRFCLTDDLLLENGDFIALARSALPAWIRRAIAAEAEVTELKNAIKELVGVDWRECPTCGMSWPHPSVRSELRCGDCRNREEKEKLRSEVARLQNLIDNHDTISSCACCGKKLAWVFAGDGTYNHEVDTGNAHICPISMDDFRAGKFPEKTYCYQERRAIAAEVRIKQLENTCSEVIAMLQTQLESRKP